MIFYGDFKPDHVAKFYYGLRAIAEGTFILPPISAEAMCVPMKASIASSGRVTAKKPTPPEEER